MSDNNNTNGGGCVGWVLEWAVFILGAVLMFAKTSELLAAFAPKEIMGYVGLENLYGAASALMVEGLFVAIKLSNDPVLNDRSRSTGQWFTDTVIMVIPFAISVLAQPVDAFVIQGTLSGQPAEVQFLVSWLVPMVPGLIVGMILIKSRIDSLPEDITRKFGQKQGGGQKFQKPNINWSRLDPRKWFQKNGKERRAEQKPIQPEQEKRKEKNPTPASIDRK